MPKSELRYPRQVEAWPLKWSEKLTQPTEMILIGSAASLLYYDEPLL
jgi:hypothetical protein